MNLRQRDYRNFMRCLDLNVLYTDEKEEDYNYAPVKSTPTSSQIKLKDNKEELMKDSYKRYLENRMRESFGFFGTPIRLAVREKSDKER